MMMETDRPFLAAGYRIKYVTEAWEDQGAAALRRQVFCREQRLFHRDDRDEIDAVAIPLVALSLYGVVPDAVVGTVRIHEEQPGLWWGSRLAVDAAYRKVGALGAALIRLAVGSAHGRGCRRFLAHVQEQNVVLFRRLHWRSLAVVERHGLIHHQMEADLDHYPPLLRPEVGFTALRKSA